MLNKQLAQMELAQRIGPIMQEILKDYRWEGPPPSPLAGGDLTLDKLIKMSQLLRSQGI